MGRMMWNPASAVLGVQHQGSPYGQKTYPVFWYLKNLGFSMGMNL
jgi:hypothetical protein